MGYPSVNARGIVPLNVSPAPRSRNLRAFARIHTGEHSIRTRDSELHSKRVTVNFAH
jgi:hypothetical protein